LRKTAKKFGDVVDKYLVLKLPLNLHNGPSYTIESDFQIAGAEVREKIRNDEKRLLSLYFENWRLPFYGKLNGWRVDSPLYILHKDILVSGIYLCDNNEFNEGINWGQLHYFYTEPAYKKRGLHSILVELAIKKAKSWNLQGLLVNTDRYLLAEVYMRRGAVIWKEIKKANPFKSSSTFRKIKDRLYLL
jgi:GNAT superfamily N-acetyltransferase